MKLWQANFISKVQDSHFPLTSKGTFYIKTDTEALNIYSSHLLLFFASYSAVTVINMLKRNFM